MIKLLKWCWQWSIVFALLVIATQPALAVPAIHHGRHIQGSVDRGFDDEMDRKRSMSHDEQEYEIEERAIHQERKDQKQAIQLKLTSEWRHWSVGSKTKVVARPVKSSPAYVWLQLKNKEKLQSFKTPIVKELRGGVWPARIRMRCIDNDLLKVNKRYLAPVEISVLKGMEKRVKHTKK
ncbi:hypothetical protein M0R72_14640 [Candidatus Pacearchaeota archaeon]|nr:hypothetical protein [Candidatus Pacearchaeota archaeon]